MNAISKDEWSALAKEFSDCSIYQSWDYAEVNWGYCQIDRLVMRQGETLVALAQVIVLALPFVRVAYVPWGPLWRKRRCQEDVRVFERTVRVLKEEYVGQRKMTLRIRPYGFEGRDDAIERAVTTAGYSQRGSARRSRPRTILVDLQCEEAELRKRLSKKWRNSLVQSERQGLTIRESFDEAPLLLLKPLYHALTTKKGFEGVDLDALAVVQSALPPEQKMRVTLCSDETGVIAGSVCSGIGSTALGLLGVTGADGRRKKAYYLLQWDEILWAKKSAHQAYDLNGINPQRNAPVYHFKSGLRGDELTFLGAFDCSPGRLSAAFVRAADWTLGVFTKGRMIRFLRRARTSADGRRRPGRRQQ